LFGLTREGGLRLLLLNQHPLLLEMRMDVGDAASIELRQLGAPIPRRGECGSLLSTDVERRYPKVVELICEPVESDRQP
jgi:hypothetical protein